MPDIFVYNGGKQTLDTTSSMSDLVLQVGVLVPPGTQAHISLPDASAFAAFVAQLQNYGTVAHVTVTQPATFTGTSQSPAPIMIPGKPVPIVTAPVVAPAKKDR